jgi:hypothetical protein
MAVLMTAHIPGGTQEMVDGLRPLLERIRSQKGFRRARKRPRARGWRVTEVRDSQADFESWFEGNVKPAFPEGGPMPSIAFDQLNEVMTA